jgi:RNA polymerase sigma factor (sigma-70 family)
MMTSARSQETTSRPRLARDDVARLVARAADGDHGAWNALIDEFGAVVWAATRAHRLNEADAADVFQTTWMRLVEHVDRIHDPASVGAWLATTARRQCLGVIRRAARLVPLGDDLPDVPSDAPNAGELLVSRQDAAVIRAALAQLSPRDRMLLRMLATEPAPSYDEIGAALGMAIGSIGPTRARALERLRREVARAGMTAEAAIGSLA